MKCHRCGQTMTLFVVGDDYCPDCKRDLRLREISDRRFEQNRLAFRRIHPSVRAKDLTPVA